MALKIPASKAARPFDTAAKKLHFETRFAEIVQCNEKLINQYSIHFFDSPATSNYGFTGLDGKSINVTQYLSDSEMDAYRVLKGVIISVPAGSPVRDPAGSGMNFVFTNNLYDVVTETQFGLIYRLCAAGSSARDPAGTGEGLKKRKSRRI
jgi:hypothetical protein